jgi:hypothetical protein
MWGDYLPTSGTGTIYAKFRNDSTATISGRIVFVITEDSIYYIAPFDTIHNHVARDYLPDQNGEVFTIIPNDSVLVNRNFTIPPTWNMDKCEIVTWIQNDSLLLPDSTKEIWQAGFKKVSELIGIEDVTHDHPFSEVKSIPNPCTNGTRFMFNLAKGEQYSIALYDVSGRRIRILNGVATGNEDSIKWDCRDDNGVLVCSGIYFYYFKRNVIHTIGKVVVK